MTTTITLNGAKAEFADGTTLTDLVIGDGEPTRGFAVCVDGEVVPRAMWDGVTLREGQVVELISAVQGG
jgi:sulfur carrier protein